MEIEPEHLDAVHSLYQRGLYLQAYKLAEAHAPLKSWSGTRARILAGRLAANLGAGRLGQVLHFLAYRDDPSDPEAIFFWAWSVLDRRGVLTAWEMQESHGDLAEAPPALRADFCALRALTFG